MRVRGETEADRERERKLLALLADEMQSDWGQVPRNSAKYRIDGWLYSGSQITAWVECKWTCDGKTAFCHLNAPKFQELCLLSAMYKCKSYYVVREGLNWGYALIHDGSRCQFNRSVYLTGGTPKHREANDDDIEPMVKIPREKIIWRQVHAIISNELDF